MRRLIVLGALIAVTAVGCSQSRRDDAPAARTQELSPYAQAEQAYSSGKLDQAVALLRDIPEGAPEAAHAHNLLGMIHAGRDDLRLAQFEFEKAVHLAPNLVMARANLGAMQLEAGDYEAAEENLLGVVEAEIYNAPAHLGLAEVYYRTGRLDEAKAELAIVDELADVELPSTGGDLERGRLPFPAGSDLALLIEEEEAAQAAEIEQAAAAERERAARARREATARAAAERKEAEAKRRAAATRQVTAPAGTVLEVELSQRISTSNAQLGDVVRGSVTGPLSVGGVLLVRNGAAIEGRITEVEDGGRVKGRSRLAFSFNRVQTVSGWKAIDAQLIAGSIEAPATKAADAAKIGLGAAGGAVLGKIFGDKAKVGAVIGAAAGTAIVLSTKGAPVVLEPQTTLDLKLEQPISIAVRTSAKGSGARAD